MKHAQIALELLLSFSIVSMLIVWFSNFAATSEVHTTQLSVLKQEMQIADAFSSAISLSRAKNITVMLPTPCIQKKPGVLLEYNISIDNGVLSITAEGVSYNKSVLAGNARFHVVDCPLICEIVNGSFAGCAT